MVDHEIMAVKCAIEMKNALKELNDEWDKKEFHKAYLHIQMAMDYLDGHPEKVIANFYYLVFPDNSLGLDFK